MSFVLGRHSYMVLAFVAILGDFSFLGCLVVLGRGLAFGGGFSKRDVLREKVEPYGRSSSWNSKSSPS